MSYIRSCLISDHIVPCDDTNACLFLSRTHGGVLVFTPGLGCRHHSKNPAGPVVRGREETAGGLRLGHAERGVFFGLLKARLAVPRTHYVSTVSQSTKKTFYFPMHT